MILAPLFQAKGGFLARFFISHLLPPLLHKQNIQLTSTRLPIDRSCQFYLPLASLFLYGHLTKAQATIG